MGDPRWIEWRRISKEGIARFQGIEICGTVYKQGDFVWTQNEEENDPIWVAQIVRLVKKS